MNLIDIFQPKQSLAVSDFCTRYQQVIRAKGDGNIGALSSVKKRILANELQYRCDCLKQPLDICKGIK